jgi:hypothetical protein
MSEESNSDVRQASLDSRLYERSHFLRWILGPGLPVMTDEKQIRSVPRSLRHDYRIRILIFCLVWVSAFLLFAGLEGPFVKGEYDPFGVEGLGVVEDLYFLSIILSLGLLLVVARITYSVYFATFYGDKGLLKSIDQKKLSRAKYLELVNQSFDVIQHKGKKARLGFWLIVVVTIVYLAAAFWAHMAEGPDHDYWYKWSHPFGSATWMIFVVVMVGFIGTELAWRVLAMIHQTRKIIKAVSKENALVVPARVPAKEGLGSVFSLAYIMALVPLTPIVSLVAWLAFSGGSLLDQAFIAALIMAATALIAFFSTAVSLVSAARKQKAREINEISSAIDDLYRRFRQTLEEGSALGDTILDKLSYQMSILNQIRQAKIGESVYPTDSLFRLIGVLIIQIAVVAMSPNLRGFWIRG